MKITNKLILLGLIILSLVLFINANDSDSIYTSSSPEIEELKETQEVVDGFTNEDRDLIEKSSEKYNFNADVTRLMDIIINSLYTHKEVFIRELISNASDACDKARFLAVQNPDFLGNKKDLEIRIETDPAAKTFTIYDSGVGMTKNDLVKNLGTIAKSGTTSFIEAISKGNSLNLIGQFGVGFYSTYLVSNKVVVTSRNSEDDQYVWVSTAGSYFSVSKDPRGNTLERGTRVTLHLKEDAQEFVEADIVRKNIKKYSEFINYPIYLRLNKTFTREEEIPEEKKEEEVSEKSESTDDLEVTDEKSEDKKDEKKPKTRTVHDWKFEWELINENKPLWLREKKEITKEEYSKFYKALTKDTEDPLSHEHHYTEGEVNFKYILYIPQKRPYDLFENYYGKNSALKLYVRRVLVNEQFEELMPRYLNFIKGVVDSDDLPLNVSREQLQQHKMIKVMSNKLTKTAIQMMIKLAVEKDVEDDEDEDEEEDDETENNEEKKEDEEKKDKEKDKKTESKYTKFYENFGKNIKLGVIEDVPNRNKLAKLLRFYSTKNPKDLISLDDYIKNMKAKQEFIYYLAGEEKEVIFKSPLIQKLRERDIEVLLLDDPIDEFCIQNLTEYEKKKLKNVGKGDLKLWDEDEEATKKRDEKIKKEFSVLTTWWKKILGDKVNKIEISKRLTNNPCIVVSSEHGYSASMERIQKAQAFSNQDKTASSYLYGKKTLEINPDHPAIKELRIRVLNAETPSLDVEDTAKLLFESALLESGYTLADPHEFAERMERVLKYNLNLDRYAKSEPYEVEVEVEEEKKEEPKKDENIVEENKDEVITEETRHERKDDL
jgi:heat shock protein 90kDa beta